MLKSLEKLMSRGLYYFDHDMDAFIPYDINNAANEIQAEIDKYYIARPLFEDYEPVQFGDMIQGVSNYSRDQRVRFERIIYYDTGRVRLDVAGGDGRTLEIGERVSRPSEPDTQEKIDADFKKLKSDAEANVLTSGVFGAYEVKGLIDGFNAILARQRKLDGVE